MSFGQKMNKASAFIEEHRPTIKAYLESIGLYQVFLATYAREKNNPAHGPLRIGMIQSESGSVYINTCLISKHSGLIGDPTAIHRFSDHKLHLKPGVKYKAFVSHLPDSEPKRWPGIGTFVQEGYRPEEDVCFMQLHENSKEGPLSKSLLPTYLAMAECRGVTVPKYVREWVNLIDVAGTHGYDPIPSPNWVKKAGDIPIAYQTYFDRETKGLESVSAVILKSGKRVALSGTQLCSSNTKDVPELWIRAIEELSLPRVSQDK